jgi:natural product biosynthesis luciferase-like monooxygenase protein
MRSIDFSLFYFSADEGADPGQKYQLLLDGARFADRNGFTAIWTPERHFHAFGGLYPNPAVTGAAVAAITERVEIRSGSVVLPLHHPARVAEEWAVVDNISGGRVGVSFASGWQSDDFCLRPDNFEDRKAYLYEASRPSGNSGGARPSSSLVPGETSRCGRSPGPSRPSCPSG